MVAYQPTPAFHIFSLIAHAGLAPGNVLIDLGSGLGHVPLLAAVLTGARSIGIEIEKSYVAAARRTAARLAVTGASFIHGNALHAPLSAGDIFYLHTPFKGAMLRQMLARLRQQSRLRPIRICTFGPCAEAVAHESWLKAETPPAAGRISLFWSRDDLGPSDN